MKRVNKIGHYSFKYIDVILRPVRLNEAQKMFDAVNASRKTLEKWLPWVKGTKMVSDTKQFINRTKDWIKKKSNFALGIFSLDNKTYYGQAGLHRVKSINREGEIGYWLTNEAVGKGYATKASIALMYFGFEQLKLNKIVIRCEPRNKRSSSIPKRLGFKLEAHLRDDIICNNRFRDTELYSMLRREWLKKKNKILR
jgi:ribosomal-protein-serine acetyltransferase